MFTATCFTSNTHGNHQVIKLIKVQPLYFVSIKPFLLPSRINQAAFIACCPLFGHLAIKVMGLVIQFGCTV